MEELLTGRGEGLVMEGDGNVKPAMEELLFTGRGACGYYLIKLIHV